MGKICSTCSSCSNCNKYETDSNISALEIEKHFDKVIKLQAIVRGIKIRKRIFKIFKNRSYCLDKTKEQTSFIINKEKVNAFLSEYQINSEYKEEFNNKNLFKIQKTVYKAYLNAFCRLESLREEVEDGNFDIDYETKLIREVISNIKNKINNNNTKIENFGNLDKNQEISIDSSLDTINLPNINNNVDLSYLFYLLSNTNSEIRLSSFDTTKKSSFFNIFFLFIYNHLSKVFSLGKDFNKLVSFYLSLYKAKLLKNKKEFSFNNDNQNIEKEINISINSNNRSKIKLNNIINNSDIELQNTSNFSFPSITKELHKNENSNVNNFINTTNEILNKLIEDFIINIEDGEFSNDVFEKSYDIENYNCLDNNRDNKDNNENSTNSNKSPNKYNTHNLEIIKANSTNSLKLVPKLKSSSLLVSNNRDKTIKKTVKFNFDSPSPTHNRLVSNSIQLPILNLIDTNSNEEENNNNTNKNNNYNRNSKSNKTLIKNLNLLNNQHEPITSLRKTKERNTQLMNFSLTKSIKEENNHSINSNNNNNNSDNNRFQKENTSISFAAKNKINDVSRLSKLSKQEREELIAKLKYYNLSLDLIISSIYSFNYEAKISDSKENNTDTINNNKNNKKNTSKLLSNCCYKIITSKEDDNAKYIYLGQYEKFSKKKNGLGFYLAKNSIDSINNKSNSIEIKEHENNNVTEVKANNEKTLVNELLKLKNKSNSSKSTVNNSGSTGNINKDKETNNSINENNNNVFNFFIDNPINLISNQNTNCAINSNIVSNYSSYSPKSVLLKKPNNLSKLFNLNNSSDIVGNTNTYGKDTNNYYYSNNHMNNLNLNKQLRKKSLISQQQIIIEEEKEDKAISSDIEENDKDMSNKFNNNLYDTAFTNTNSTYNLSNFNRTNSNTSIQKIEIKEDEINLKDSDPQDSIKEDSIVSNSNSKGNDISNNNESSTSQNNGNEFKNNNNDTNTYSHQESINIKERNKDFLNTNCHFKSNKKDLNKQRHSSVVIDPELLNQMMKNFNPYSQSHSENPDSFDITTHKEKNYLKKNNSTACLSNKKSSLRKLSDLNNNDELNRDLELRNNNKKISKTSINSYFFNSSSNNANTNNKDNNNSSFSNNVCDGFNNKLPKYIYYGFLKNNFFNGCGIFLEKEEIYDSINHNDNQDKTRSYKTNKTSSIMNLRNKLTSKINPNNKEKNAINSQIISKAFRYKIIKGEFQNGKLNGYGEKKTSEYQYSGFFSNNEFHGFGELRILVELYNNDNDSDVDNKNNKQSTKGVYCGCFYKGTKNGIGIEKKDNNDTYIGWFKNNKPHGIGQMTWNNNDNNNNNGEKYFGEWREGNIQGFGKLLYSNKEFYVGNFKNNKKHGKGSYYFSHNNTFLEGVWVDGKKEGEFSLTSNEHYYIVYYKNDEQIQKQ